MSRSVQDPEPDPSAPPQAAPRAYFYVPGDRHAEASAAGAQREGAPSLWWAPKAEPEVVERLLRAGFDKVFEDIDLPTVAWQTKT